jgi:hypothetical protein
MEEALSRSLREVAGVAVVRSRSGGATVLAAAVQVMLRAIIQIMESLYTVPLGVDWGRFIESCGICSLAWVYFQERAHETTCKGTNRATGGVDLGTLTQAGGDAVARPGTQTLHGPQE